MVERTNDQDKRVSLTPGFIPGMETPQNLMNCFNSFWIENRQNLPPPSALSLGDGSDEETVETVMKGVDRSPDPLAKARG